jgi:hypothetical protein
MRLLLAAILAAVPVAASANRYDDDTFKLTTGMTEAQVEQRLGPPARVEMLTRMKKWQYQEAASPDQLEVYFSRSSVDSPRWFARSWKVH